MVEDSGGPSRRIDTAENQDNKSSNNDESSAVFKQMQVEEEIASFR